MRDESKAKTDKEREEESRKKRRALLLALFALLVLNTQDDVRKQVQQVVAGQIDPHQFGVAMGAVLSPAHAHAAYLGRQLAGITVPFGQADADYGRSVMDEQREYLLPFVDAIARGQYAEDGKQDADAIEERALFYVKRLLGTANEAWVGSLPAGTVLIWSDANDPGECDDCRELAKNSPYTPETIPTVPGNCDTQCLFNCMCRVYVDGGEEGFVLTA